MVQVLAGRGLGRPVSQGPEPGSQEPERSERWRLDDSKEQGNRKPSGFMITPGNLTALSHFPSQTVQGAAEETSNSRERNLKLLGAGGTDR